MTPGTSAEPGPTPVDGPSPGAQLLAPDFARLRREAGTPAQQEAEWARVIAALTPVVRAHLAPKLLPGEDPGNIVREAWRCAHRGVATLSNGAAFVGWLFVIADRALISARRKEATRRSRAAEWGARTSLGESTDRADERLFRRLTDEDSRPLLRAVIERLKPRDRRMIVGIVFEGLSHAELAEALDLASVRSSEKRWAEVKKRFARVWREVWPNIDPRSLLGD